MKCPVYEDWTLKHVAAYGATRKENYFQITFLAFLIAITII
jgi:hypothetical protein